MIDIVNNNILECLAKKDNIIIKTLELVTEAQSIISYIMKNESLSIQSKKLIENWIDKGKNLGS